MLKRGRVCKTHMLPLIVFPPRTGVGGGGTNYIDTVHKVDHYMRNKRKDPEETDFKGKVLNLNRNKKRRELDVSLEDLPAEIKSIVLRMAMVNDSYADACELMQAFCAASRGMCSDDMWSDMATTLFAIPTPKPESMPWNTWIRKWCYKLTAYSPWSSTLRAPTAQNPTPSPDHNVFDFTREECIWRLRKSDSYQSVDDKVFVYRKSSIAAGIVRPVGGPKLTGLFAPFWPDDAEWAQEALIHDGRILQHLKETMRDDADMVRLACFSNPAAITYASERLRNSSEFIRSFMFSQPEILLQNGHTKDDLQLNSIRAHIAAVRVALRNHPKWIQLHPANGGAINEDASNGFSVRITKLLDESILLEPFASIGIEITKMVFYRNGTKQAYSATRFPSEPQ